MEVVKKQRLCRSREITELISEVPKWCLGLSILDPWRVYYICRFMQVFIWLGQVIELNRITTVNGTCPWNAVFNERERACIRFWMYLTSPTTEFNYLEEQYTLPQFITFIQFPSERKKYLEVLKSLQELFRTMHVENNIVTGYWTPMKSREPDTDEE